MNKYAFLLFIFLPVFMFGQETRTFYTGIYLSDKEGNFGFVQWESDIDLAILRAEYLTNFNGDDRVYLKMAVQVWKRKQFRFFVALPPFHYLHKVRKYNTPINFEVMIKKKVLLNLDLYKNNFNVSIQLRQKF